MKTAIVVSVLLAGALPAIAQGNPAAPIALTATVSTANPTRIGLNWIDRSTDEDEFRIEHKTPTGFVDLGSASRNATVVNVAGFAAGTLVEFRVRARRGASFSDYSNEIAIVAGLDTATCTPNQTTLCIDDGPADKRFEVKFQYHTAQGGGLAGDGHAIPLNSLGVNQGGLFWFLSANNPEMLVKILKACYETSGTYWLFHSAGTNFAFNVTARDTKSGAKRAYGNSDRTPALPVQDLSTPFPCLP